MVAVENHFQVRLRVGHQGAGGSRHTALDAAHRVEEVGGGHPAPGPAHGAQKGGHSVGVRQGVAHAHPRPGRREGQGGLQGAGQLWGQGHGAHDPAGEGLSHQIRSRVHGVGRLGAQAAHADEGAFEVRARQVGPAGDVARFHDLAHAAQGCQDPVPGLGDGRGQQGGGAVPGVLAGQCPDALGAVHRVAAATAVHMRVDETGDDPAVRRAVQRLEDPDLCPEVQAAGPEGAFRSEDLTFEGGGGGRGGGKSGGGQGACQGEITTSRGKGERASVWGMEP